MVICVIGANSVVTTDGDITIDEVLDIRGAVTVNKDAEVSIESNGDVNVKGGTLVNDGTIEVDGKFAMLDAQGTTVASAGQNMTNNGTFIDNVGSTIGGATQYMNQNGEYICKVNSEYRLSEAYVNKTACSTIQFVELNSTTTAYNYVFTATPVQHNGEHVKIVVDVANVTFTPGKAITIGELTVNSGADLNIAKTSTSTVNKVTVLNTITVVGDINVTGDFSTATGVVNMTADNMTVNKGGTATFANRESQTDKTMEISSTIEVKNGATFTITDAIGTNLPAYITCTKLIEGGTFNGKPEVIL